MQSSVITTKNTHTHTHTHAQCVPCYWLDISICHIDMHSSESLRFKHDAMSRRWKFRKYFPHFHISIHPYLHFHIETVTVCHPTYTQYISTDQQETLFIIFVRGIIGPLHQRNAISNNNTTRRRDANNRWFIQVRSCVCVWFVYKCEFSDHGGWTLLVCNI